jgi:low affinity Fe/Cu permease
LTDNALEQENIDDLLSKLDAHIESVVREKYDRVIMLEKTKDESLEDGREYVEAYVDYTHTLVAIHSILEEGPGQHHED